LLALAKQGTEAPVNGGKDKQKKPRQKEPDEKTIKKKNKRIQS